MKFANKYELFEAVTSGRVETFFAKDLAGGERVLLHIFEAPEKKTDQPTVQWVLESFRKVAPDPAGLVVETGRYSGTTYAYLVTKLPDNAALQHWKQSYESFAAETQEVAVPSDHASPEVPAISKDLPKPDDRPADEVQSASPTTDFTAAFSELAASARPCSTRTDKDEVNFESEQPAPQREPGDFTRQFFSGSHEIHQTPPPQAPDKLAEASASPNREVSRISPKIQKPAKAEGETESPAPPASSGGQTGRSVPSPDAGGFTALFQSDFKPETKVPSESIGASRKSDDANAGDFTDFFRGPFDKERPAETPIILPKALDTPQRNAPGEFTRVFGSGKDGPLATMPLHEPAGDPPREPGSFTQSFPDANQPASPPPTNASLPKWEATAPKSETPPPFKEAWTPPAPVPPSIKPNFPQPTISNTLRDAEPSLPDGATHVFSAPGAGPVSGLPPLTAGPSEYTRIISGGMAGPTPAGAPVAGGPPGFKMPGVPAVPPAPKIAVPPPPKFSPPAAPKAPKLEIKAPKAKQSYLPLVIILNVLLFVAILLIVYFALKR